MRGREQVEVETQWTGGRSENCAVDPRRSKWVLERRPHKKPVR